VPATCYSCRTALAADEGPRCRRCVDRRNRWYEAQREAGLCVQTGCHRRAAPGRVRCRKCHKANRELAHAAQVAARKGKTRADRPY
jgi:hypothetical protein